VEKRKYQILLTEEFLDTSLFPESAFVGGYVSRPVLEIGSSDANYSWQVHDVEFYTKIDGTHTLSFSLDAKYFDEDAGALVDNELVKYLTNKCKIEVRRENLEYRKENKPYAKKKDILKGQETVYDTYFMVVNDKEDKDDKGIISYTYSCTDAYVEELSKTGYEIQFSDDIEVGNGLGTIHDFSKQVAAGTDWVYREDKTGTLIEYLTDVQWNEEQQRFDEVYTPIPSHTYKFIPEISQYAYQLETLAEVKDGYYKPFYCAEMMDMTQTIPAKNLISNGDDFTDSIGWKALSTGTPYVVGPYQDNGEYYLQISNSNSNPSYLLNDTMTNNRTILQAYQPYIFRYTTKGNKNIFKGLYIHNQYKNAKDMNDRFKYKVLMDFKPNTYYVIKPTTNISNPYFYLYTEIAGTTDVISVEFFKAQGKDEASQVSLIASLANGASATAAQLNKMLLPSDAGEDIDAYYDKKVRYFYRDNYKIQLSTNVEVHEDPFIDDELEFVSFDDINNAEYKLAKVDGVTSIVENKPLPIQLVSELPETGEDNKIYQLSTDNYYYQYYKVERNGITNGKWNYARFGSGQVDKIRTLVISKSNRFNIIQEIAELFRVWPVFEVHRNEDGALVKEFWYKESALRDNFAGFHKGINLSSITRKLESDEIVTKMYVEDVEKSYITDGKISIAETTLNPWGERYYYNFRHYIEHKLVGPEIDRDKEELYRQVKVLNENEKETYDKYNTYYKTYRDNQDKIKLYSYQISACTETMTSLKETIDGLVKEGADEALPDLVNARSSYKNQSKQKSKYKKESDKLQKQNDKIKIKLDNLSASVTSIDTQKKTLISQFETKYSQFIKEGTWVDSSYADSSTYYIDSQKVSNTSAIPKASWTINVIDGGGAEELKDFFFKVGDKTFLVDNDFFYRPTEEGRDYKFEILITGYHDYFDNSQKNQIEVRNYLTSFEDLFQRISAATQTLELNEQIYDKADRFTANGEISSAILQKSLINNNFVLTSSDDNSYELDVEGLKLQSIPNPTKRVRITADGIFISKQTGDNGEPVWSTGITGDGINASLITAGEIDTSLIKIFGGSGQELFAWNELGITAYHSHSTSGTKDTSKYFTRFDQFGLYVIEGDSDFNYNQEGSTWFKDITRTDAINKIQDKALVSITDNGFKLNIKKSQGRLTLGFLNEQKSDYGLLIERKLSGDSDFKTIAKLSSNGYSELGGFDIGSSGLHSKDQRLSYYTTGILMHDYNTNGEPIEFVADLSGLPFYATHSVLGKLDITPLTGWNFKQNHFWFGQYNLSDISHTSIHGDGSTGTLWVTKLYVNGQEVVPGGSGGGDGTFINPLNNYNDIYKSADYPKYPSGGRHTGIDYCCSSGTLNKQVVAIHDGTIESVTHSSTGYGNHVVINHPDYQIRSLYGHASSIATNPSTGQEWQHGDSVQKGQVIMYAGESGNVTGPHVHLEIRVPPYTYDRDDIDPETYVAVVNKNLPATNVMSQSQIATAQRIINYLTVRGLTTSAAVGICGNVYGECSFDYSQKVIDSDGYWAGGMCMWNDHYGNLTRMSNYVASHYPDNPDWRTNLEGQCDYLVYDMKGNYSETSGTYQSRLKSTNEQGVIHDPTNTITLFSYLKMPPNTWVGAQKVADTFVRVYEYPGSIETASENRQKWAREVWNKLINS